MTSHNPILQRCFIIGTMPRYSSRKEPQESVDVAPSVHIREIREIKNYAYGKWRTAEMTT